MIETLETPIRHLKLSILEQWNDRYHTWQLQVKTNDDEIISTCYLGQSLGAEIKDKALRIRQLRTPLRICRFGVENLGDRKRSDGLLLSQRITDLETQLSDELKN